MQAPGCKTNLFARLTQLSNNRQEQPEQQTGCPEIDVCLCKNTEEAAGLTPFAVAAGRGSKTQEFFGLDFQCRR